MSFDAFIMHEFATRLHEVDRGLNYHPGTNGGITTAVAGAATNPTSTASARAKGEGAGAGARQGERPTWGATFKAAGQATMATERIRRATPSLAASTQQSQPTAGTAADAPLDAPDALPAAARRFGGYLPKLMLLTVADKAPPRCEA